MTHRLIQRVAVLAAIVVVAGCFESKTVVNVEKDGSGTIEQTVYYKEMSMGPPGLSIGGAPPAEVPAEPSAEEKLAETRASAEQTAAAMGEGVSLKSVEALPARNGRQGVRIVYAFTDINNVKMDVMPDVDLGGGMRIGSQGGQVGNVPPGEAAPPAADDEKKVRFEFAAAPSPKLTIITPEMTPPAEGEAPPEEDPQAQAMAKMMMTQMLDGMLLELRVKVDGKISETNATYAKQGGSEAGLYRMNFGSLVKDEPALDMLLKVDPGEGPEAAKKLLQDPMLAKHLKLETNQRVDVAFE